MKTLIFKILPLLFVVVWAGGIKSQTITTTAGSVTSCPGEIQVPVNVTNCNGVGAISLVLNFDTTKLSYIGYQNLNTALTSGFLIIHSSGNKIVISWANTTAANLGNSTLVQLRFNATTSTTSLTWDTQTSGNCEYANVSGTVLAASFANGTATINQLASISAQPIDRSILLGQSTSFSLGVSGTGITYLWQISTNGGNTWSDLSNNSIYSGVTSSNLGVTNPPITYSGYKYRCGITGTCSQVLYSNSAVLIVINPVTTTLPTASFCPGIIMVPVTVTNFTGVASFSLTFAYNASCLTYTGYQNLNGALSAGTFVINAIGGKVYMTWSSTTAATFGNDTLIKLLFSSVTGVSSLQWDVGIPGNCEYSALNGTQITSVFVNGNESIYALPSITGHPTNRIIAKGQSTSFSISASGSGVSYIWQVSTNGGGVWADLTNTAVYSNVTSPTLNISNAPLSINSYLYRCKVSGTCNPAVYSNSAMITVLPNIITTCGSATGCPGQFVIPINVSDFIDVASFSLTLNINSSYLTYTGYQNLNSAVSGGLFSINAIGNKVYLTWSNTSSATIANAGLLVELKFNGITGSSGLTWDTSIPGNCEYSDLSGQIIFSTWNNGSISIHQTPSILTHPLNSSIYAGGSCNFSVSASGLGLAYQWQLSSNGGANWINLINGTPYSGVFTSTLAISPTAIGMSGNQYRCIVSGTCTPSVTSNLAQLTVSQAAITTTPGGVSNSCSGNLNIPINVTNCNNIGGISLTMIFDTTKLTFNGYQSVNPALGGGVLVVNCVANKIYMSWASTTAASIGTGVLIQYRFTANTGISTSLNWDTPTSGACEYADLNGNIITAFYNNSNISVITNTLIVNAGSNVTIGLGGSVQLNGSISGGSTPYTYLWTPSTGLSNPAIANPIATPLTTTTYTLTGTGSNACTGSSQMTITISSLPGPAGTISGPSIVYQGQQMATYTVPLITGATGYVWSIPPGATITSGNNTNSIIVDYSNSATSGIMTVYGTNSSGDGAVSPDFPVTVLSIKTVVLHFYLEGLFDMNTNAMFAAMDGNIGEPKWGYDIADRVQIDLFEENAPYNSIGVSISGIDLSTSGIASFQISPTWTGNYYIRIRNRNHLETWSSIPVPFNTNPVEYDFSMSAFQAYGGNPQVQVSFNPDLFAFFLGDLDQGGWIDALDFNLFEPELTNGSTGFYDADFDGGGWVDALDFNMLEPRITMGNATEYPSKK